LSRLDEISEYVNHLSFDLKAEMLVAILAEQRADLAEILSAFDGQLKRVWSRDIAWSTVAHLETGDNMLCFHLNRDGIYDALPEALFHNNSGNEDQSAEEMAKDSMKIRAEEKETRMFFQPFENEIFLQRVQLSMMENKLIRSINAEFLTAVIPYFWKVDNNLPEIYVARLKKILPLVHQVTGDLALTAQCLENIIREKVEVTASDEHTEGIASGDFLFSGVLGKSTLGVDTISGNQVSDFVNRLIFSIGPINDTETGELVKAGRMDRFLDCFYGYFVPFEYETDTKYIFGTEQSLFVLNDNDDAEFSHLGYNSLI
jgi:hypothetical protein